MIVSDLSVRQRWVWVGISTLFFLLGTIVMIPHGSLHTRWNIPAFLGGAVVMLAGFYLALLRTRVPLLIIGLAAVAARMLLLWQEPGDDIYRYIWEGKLLLQNINPYLHPPDAMGLVSLRDTIWDSVQHKTFSASIRRWQSGPSPRSPWSTQACFSSRSSSPRPICLPVRCFGCVTAGKLPYSTYGTLSSSIPLPEADTTTASLSSPSCLGGWLGKKERLQRRFFGLALRLR